MTDLIYCVIHRHGEPARDVLPVRRLCDLFLAVAYHVYHSTNYADCFCKAIKNDQHTSEYGQKIEEILSFIENAVEDSILMHFAKTNQKPDGDL